VLNWLLVEFNRATLPADFRPVRQARRAQTAKASLMVALRQYL